MAVNLANPPANSQKLAVNFVLLAVGECVAKLLTFFAFSHLARVLGPERYGSLEFVLAVMVFLTLPVDFGLGAYGAREIARDKSRALSLFREITGLRLILACCSALALVVFLLLIHKNAEQEYLLGIYGVSLFAGPALLQWFFQAHDLMHWVAVASIVRQSVFAGSVVLFFKATTPMIYIGVAECASVTAVALVCLGVMRWRMGIHLKWPVLHVRRLLVHLHEAVPIGLTELAWAFIWYFATVLLGLAFADETLGWFGASHRALMALHTFVFLYFFNLLPSISRCVTVPERHLLTLMNRSLKLAAWSSVFVAFMLTTVAREVLMLIYGAEFAGGATSFAVLVWMLPIAMLSGHHRFILLAYNLQSRLLFCTGVAALVAIALGFALVPFAGGVGAALALLTANIVNFALAYREVRRAVVRVSFWQHLPGPLLALTLAFVVFAVLRTANLWVAAGVSGAAYTSVLVLFQGRKALSLMKLLASGKWETLQERLAE